MCASGAEWKTSVAGFFDSIIKKKSKTSVCGQVNEHMPCTRKLECNLEVKIVLLLL